MWHWESPLLSTLLISSLVVVAISYALNAPQLLVLVSKYSFKHGTLVFLVPLLFFFLSFYSFVYHLFYMFLQLMFKFRLFGFLLHMFGNLSLFTSLDLVFIEFGLISITKMFSLWYGGSLEVGMYVSTIKWLDASLLTLITLPSWMDFIHWYTTKVLLIKALIMAHLVKKRTYQK